MGILRKHLAWVIIGVVLIAELGAMLFVWGKQGEAKKARGQLESRRNTRDQLKRKVFGIDKRIAVLKLRKQLVRRDLGECALFVWHKGQAIEGLFDAKELRRYDLRPWQAPRNFDVFKVEYQGVYNREVGKLAPLLEKVGADPGMLAFADPAGFVQFNVTIGDIYALQKDFWIKKQIVKILAASGALLRGISVGESAAGPHRPRAPRIPGKPSVQPATLATPVPFQMGIVCEYTRFHDLLEALLRSPLCLRIDSVESIVRTRLPAPVAPPAGTPPPKAVPAGAPPGKGPAEAPAPIAVPERRQFVAVALTGVIPDINVEVQDVLFPKKTFGDRTKVLGWLDRQLRLLDLRLKRLSRADRSAAVARRPELGVTWIIRELEKAHKAAAAEPGKPITIVDEMLVRREFVFEDLKAAKEWLTHRFDFERAKLEAEQALWQKVRNVVRAGKGDEKTKLGVFDTPDGVAVTFRPAEHFDPGIAFEAQFASGARVRLGIVIVKPEESPEGVKRAASAGR